MTRLNVSKAREEFPDVLNRAAYGHERTIVSRRGKDLAAVIPMDDLRLLERLAREADAVAYGRKPAGTLKALAREEARQWKGGAP